MRKDKTIGEGNNMRFTFDLTEQDYLDFNIFVIQSYQFYKKQKKIFHILFTAIPLATGFVNWIFTREGRLDIVELVMFLVMALLSVVFYIFFPKVFDALNIRNVKKILFKEGKLNILGERSLTFEEDRLHHVGSGEEAWIGYEKITKIMTSDQAMYLFTAPAMAVILPLRAFSSQEEKERLAEFLSSKINVIS